MEDESMLIKEESKEGITRNKQNKIEIMNFKF
jgi:hypothetical protein